MNEMPDQEKIRLMTRLAILEKQHGRSIRRARGRFKTDLAANPVWKRAFAATVIFICAVSALAVLQIDMLLDAVASGNIRPIILTVLTAYVCVMLATVVASSAGSYRKYRIISRRSLEYQNLLALIERIEYREHERKDGGAGNSYRAYRRQSDPDWEADIPGHSARGDRSRGEQDELDRRHMLTLEFEDDDYSYYVEATPKKKGDRR